MMHVNRADLNLFVVFEAIFSQGGVTKAADFLNLSQPTISHALSRLRDRTGDKLFIRQGKNQVPTPLARSMIGPVRDALNRLDQTLGALNGFQPAESHMAFTIGTRSLMESTYLLPLSSLINEKAPQVVINSSPYDRRNLASSLASGELNVVIDVFLPTSKEIHSQLLSESTSVVVARQGHPMIQDEIDIQTYLEAQHVCVTSRSGGQGPEDVALARLGQTRQIKMRCQQINTAMRLVATSNAILTMSETFARRANIWFDHQILPAPFDSGRIDTYLYWHENSGTDPANIWFRNMIQAATREGEMS